MLPQKSAKSKEEMQRLLQESLRTKRPRWIRFAFFGILTAAALVALLMWFFAPPGEPPGISVVAFDDLGVAGTEVTLQGRLETAGGSAALTGQDVVFIDKQSLPVPGQAAREVAVKTGRHGEASCIWTFPPETVQGNFLLRRLGVKFRAGLEDRARIFLAPAATPLCLVQIEEALTLARDVDWRKESTLQIVPVPGAAEALREARQQGYEIVYLALAAERPTLYDKMRNWLRQRSSDRTTPLPAGVVLGRFTLPEADQERPWEKTAARLTSAFQLPKAAAARRHLAIAGTPDAAQQLHAGGLRTLFLGADTKVPAAVERLAGWEEVRRVLMK